MEAMRPYFPNLRHSRPIAVITAILSAFLLVLTAHADVIVLANRTDRPVPARFSPVSGATQQLTLPVGDVVPIFLDGKARVEFSSQGATKRYVLDANCAYYFGRAANGRLDLQKIGLGEDGTALAGRSLPGSAVGPAATITVKICVDEEEPGRRSNWERRLTRRVAAASAILEKFCGVRLEVVALERWNSDNDTNDLHASIGEFEREVSPSPARVAIGFTSQYQMVRGRVHMAGTRGPLHSHILAREGSPEISEAEKLEFLVHELGHFLGAAHSPEPGSVMRPVLGDNRAGRSDFRIQFDPVNALSVAMVGEEIRRRDIKRISELEPITRRRLRQIYMELARSLPNDPAGFHYAQLIGSTAGEPLSVAAKAVLQEIVRSAAANRALAEPIDGINDDAGGKSRRSGDKLTEYYVRQAARAAERLSKDIAPRALLLALAIGLDDSQFLASVPGVAESVAEIEMPSDRTVRLSIMGEPTMRGRRDLAKHFFVSAYLTSAQGAGTAHAAGFAKELLDAQGASGFSFADIAADRAGVRFADGVLNRRFALGSLASSFKVETFMPPVDGLPEALSAAQFKADYGKKETPKVREALQSIDERINALPPYKRSASELLIPP
jgi:hypothetical protein